MQTIKEKDGMLLIDFPNKTAKEIVEECDNKLGKGKLLYSISWYEKEKFYTDEKCRPGKRWVNKDLVGKGSNWNECDTLVKKEKGDMLNFAETIWFIKCYVEHFKEYPWSLDYSWTSSRSADGRLVHVGSCDSDGVFVDRDDPRGSDSDRGVSFAVVESGQAEGDQPDADSCSLEDRVAELERKMNTIHIDFN